MLKQFWNFIEWPLDMLETLPRCHSVTWSQNSDHNLRCSLPLLRPVRPNSRDDLVDPLSYTAWLKRFWGLLNGLGILWKRFFDPIPSRCPNTVTTIQVVFCHCFAWSGQIHGTTLSTLFLTLRSLDDSGGLLVRLETFVQLASPARKLYSF